MKKKSCYVRLSNAQTKRIEEIIKKEYSFENQSQFIRVAVEKLIRIYEKPVK